MKYCDIIPPSFEIGHILRDAETSEEATEKINRLENIKVGTVIFLEKTKACYYSFNGKQKVITLRKRIFGNKFPMTLWLRI